MAQPHLYAAIGSNSQIHAGAGFRTPIARQGTAHTLGLAGRSRGRRTRGRAGHGRPLQGASRFPIARPRALGIAGRCARGESGGLAGIAKSVPRAIGIANRASARPQGRCIPRGTSAGGDRVAIGCGVGVAGGCVFTGFQRSLTLGSQRNPIALDGLWHLGLGRWGERFRRLVGRDVGNGHFHFGVVTDRAIAPQILHLPAPGQTMQRRRPAQAT